MVAIYTGNAIDQLTPVVGDFLSHGSIRFNATAGTPYQIAVDGYQGNSGTVSLNLRQIGDNNSSTNATILPSLPSRLEVAGVGWWKFVAPADGTLRIQNLNGSASIRVYREESPTNLVLIANNDRPLPVFSGCAIEIQLEAGEMYFLSVSDYGVSSCT